MTYLPTELTDELALMCLELEVEQVKQDVVADIAFLTRHLTVQDVLALVADAYRSFPAGSLLAGRAAEVALSVEELGVELYRETDI